MTTIPTPRPYTPEALIYRLEDDPETLALVLAAAESAVQAWLLHTPTATEENVPDGWIGGQARAVIDRTSGYEEYLLMEGETETEFEFHPSPDDHTGTLGRLLREYIAGPTTTKEK